MKILRINFFIAILLLVLLIPASVAAAPPVLDAGAILVKFGPATSQAEIAAIHRQNGGQVVANISAIGVQVVSVPAGKAMEKARVYSSNPNVVYAEPDYLAREDGSTDDPYLSQQWGLIKVGAPEAWGVTTGDVGLKIAILDTGVYLTHPDLANKIVASINFTTSPSANDSYGHGTHVAGIAAAATNNGIGTAGLGYSSSILNVKVLGDDGYGSYSWISQGIIWAADNGASVINMSLGGSSASTTLESAINYAWSKGVVVVASAGNSSTSAPSYPAYYSKVIAVAATDSADNITSWSNYGDWVDVAAPGSSIYSTIINGYGYKSGTSMASPFVAGLAALVFTRVTDTNDNKLFNDEVRAQIEATCDDIGATNIGGGRINSFKAVQTNTAITIGSISGKVTDAAAGSVIQGAIVSYSTGSVTPDENGSYLISNRPAGDCALTVSAEGYVSESQTASVVAGQTATVDFALEKQAEQPVKSIWVSSMNFVKAGKNLKLDIRVTGDIGRVAGSQVSARVTLNTSKTWDFTGVTDSTGLVSFTINKAAAGTYTGTITDVTATGYTWDSSKGVSETSFTITASTKRGR